MKMIKFKDLESRINELSENYKIAKENEDTEEMDLIQEEYAQIREKLCIYSDKLKKKSAYELKKQNQSEDISEEQKDKNMRILKVKEIYEGNRKNKQFIKIVKNSDDIRDFYRKNDKKKVNFVKRHFEKFALATAGIVLLGFGLSSCSKSNKKIEEKTTSVTTEFVKEDSNTKPKEEKTTEKVEKENKSNINSTDGRIKLNALPEYEDNNEYVSENDAQNNKGNNSNVEKNANSDDVKFTYNNDSFKKQEKVEELDPHVNNNDSGKKTTVEVKKETPAKESKPVDFNTKTTDNTNINKKETTTTTYKEEGKNLNTDGLKVDGEKEAVDFIPTNKDEKLIPDKEIVTIVYEEEKEDVNTNNIKIDEEKDSTIKENNNTTNETIIYEETEEKEEMNLDNLEIDETTSSVYTKVYKM